MVQYFSKSIMLLFFLVMITCGLYPLALWLVGQTLFPFQANGSLLVDADGKWIGSTLIAQPFTKDEYFQPRPSAASYNAAASASSSLAASNYALRDRIANTLGPMVKYQNGQVVGPDIEKWYQQDTFQGKPHLLAQWAALHHSLAAAWMNNNSVHRRYVDNWIKAHPVSIPKATDLAAVFFQNFSKENPGKFPSSVLHIDANGKHVPTIEAVNRGADIQSMFFDMWRQDHPNIALQNVPGDLVTTSGSGLDPHITLQNAFYQLDRVSHAWAAKLKRNPDDIKKEIRSILQAHLETPFGGIIGEAFVNVFVLNIELHKRYGKR